MKKLFFLFLLLVGCATASFTDLQNSEEISVKGTKSQNYQKSLQWIASNFGSAKAIIEYQNPGEGKIIGNIITKNAYMGASLRFKTLMTITVKNKGAKIDLLAREVNQAGSGWREIYESESSLVHESYEPIIGSYKNFMK